MENQWKHKIFNVTRADFDELALEIFRFQYSQNSLYRSWVDAVRTPAREVRSISRIPFLPIRFFKTHEVRSTVFDAEVFFESTGTGGSGHSRHFVKDMETYRESFLRAFELFYGPVRDWCIIGLLPSYLERKNSSLVAMVDELVRRSGHPKSGFYLRDFARLSGVLRLLEEGKQKTMLFGVTFALLDFAESFPMPLKQTVIMETGGMKGRRVELIRQEVHDLLKAAFQVPEVHSEYGMTEMLSQAYSAAGGVFISPPWMKVLLRDEEDPMSVSVFRAGERPGAINIIDLANVYSCSFIATDDAGRLVDDGRFEVLGRIDHSDLRGCSLMTI